MIAHMVKALIFVMNKTNRRARGKEEEEGEREREREKKKKKKKREKKKKAGRTISAFHVIIPYWTVTTIQSVCILVSCFNF